MKNPSDTFYDDLRAFRAQYPMCYIEAWTPTDYVNAPMDANGDEAADWNDDDHVFTTSRLEDTFDANQGTNWDAIRNVFSN